MPLQARVKQLSKEFAEQRKEQQQRLQEEAFHREQREVEARAKRMARNAEVVSLRQQMDELKRQEAAQKRVALEQEQLERAAALEKAMEKLKVEAPRDPARLHKAPARLSAEAYLDPMVCVTRGPHAGFDEKSLMADARYKLSAALQAFRASVDRFAKDMDPKVSKKEKRNRCRESVVNSPLETFFFRYGLPPDIEQALWNEDDEFAEADEILSELRKKADTGEGDLPWGDCLSRSWEDGVLRVTRSYAAGSDGSSPDLIIQEFPYSAHPCSGVGGTGGMVWPGAILLASQLRRRSELLSEASVVLELGAGCGLPGLAAASLLRNAGESRVILTDGPE
ncbi:Lace1, partial [Symbiodinium sp. KB8]